MFLYGRPEDFDMIDRLVEVAGEPGRAPGAGGAGVAVSRAGRETIQLIDALEET
jgi:hypothetical protein